MVCNRGRGPHYQGEVYLGCYTPGDETRTFSKYNNFRVQFRCGTMAAALMASISTSPLCDVSECGG